MSVSFDQLCYYGFEIDVDSIKVVDSPAIYEEQNRYDTITGKITKREKVLVASEKYHFVFQNVKYAEPEDIGYDYQCQHGMYWWEENRKLVLGFNIVDLNNVEYLDYSNNSLIEGKLYIKELQDLHSKLEGIFGKDSFDFGLIFMPRIG
jgi:hypothetical protein